MDHDDVLLGRLLSRRDALIAPGSAGFGELLDRSDIRSDPVTGAVKAGTRLILAINGAAERANGTVGQKFLRGYQTTDANGHVEFTIRPGWYSGRAVHIHFRIRNALTATSSLDTHRSCSFLNRSKARSTHSSRMRPRACATC